MDSILGRGKRGSIGLVPQRNRTQRLFDEQTVTGSLSLGGPSLYSSSSNQSHDGLISSMRHSDRDDRPNKPSIEKSSSLFSMPSRKEGRKSSTEGMNMMTMSLVSPHGHHNEPQLTPSISNIGGAVLRSKTADFERLLLQNKKSSGSSGILSAGESNVSAQITDTTPDTTAASQIKKQPIYKRKELISSVQSSKK